MKSGFSSSPNETINDILNISSIGGNSMAKRAGYKTKSIKPSLYGKVIDALLSLTEDSSINIGSIKRIDIIRSAGINEQQFDTNFRSVDDIYKEIQNRFKSEVVYWLDAGSRNSSNNDFWRLVLVAVMRRNKECRIALRRHDYSFWNNGLSLIISQLKVLWPYASDASLGIAYVMILAIFIYIIRLWEQNDFDECYRGEVLWILKEFTRYLSNVANGYKDTLKSMELLK